MNGFKVIFLDIDGVLQPYNSNKRFEVARQGLVDYLSNKHNIDYSQYNELDLAAVYYDWDKEAINIIRNILQQTNSKIVISSNWKNPRLPNKMRDLLRIHNLDNYYLGDTPYIIDISNYQDKLQRYHYKVVEILDYLERNKNIINYVVIDDLDLSHGLNNHFVKTHNVINESQSEECIRILKKTL